MKNIKKTLLNYREKMAALIVENGGELDDSGRFVVKPGCSILSLSQETDNGSSLYALLNIDTNRPAYEQRAEFKSRLTYLSFLSEPNNGGVYNKKMAQDYQHLSVHSSTYVEFLIAGVSVETCLEFVSHAEAKVARLTSSKTKAMDDTLYRLQGNDKEQQFQKQFIQQFLQFKHSLEAEGRPRDLSSHGTEFTNMLNLCSKVNVFTYCMNLKDYHKLFIGRLSTEGNEQEVQEVCTMMCRQLHEKFPLVIREPNYYYESNNGKKYAIS